MRILVTGSRGVIGTQLTETLKARGHEVWGCDLAHSNDNKYFRCDISEFRQLRDVFKGCQPELVYNCAAEFGRWNGEAYYEKVWKTNAIGCKNVILLCIDHDVKLVHFSSSEVYGDYKDIMSEDVMDMVAIKQMNDYAMSKWVNEMQILNEIESGLESVRVRLFNTYGPGEWFHPYRSVNCTFTYKLIHGKPITVYSGHTRSSTYIVDCITALANISENFIPDRVYNIGSGSQHDIETLAGLIVKASGADPELVSYAESEAQTTKDKRVENSFAVEELGFRDSVTLEEGVKNTVEWMRKYYGLS